MDGEGQALQRRVSLTTLQLLCCRQLVVVAHHAAHACPRGYITAANGDDDELYGAGHRRWARWCRRRRCVGVGCRKSGICRDTVRQGQWGTREEWRPPQSSTQRFRTQETAHQ